MVDSTSEIANVEMAAAWDGEEGDDWTENAHRYEATDRYLQVRFEEALQLRRDDVVLDVGCGTGATSLAAARIVQDGSVLGVDLSTRMLGLGDERAVREGLTNVTFLRADAQVHPFDEGAFTVAISTFGTMFFGDPTAAFANIGRAMAPSGRLVMMVWRRFEDNEWLRAFFAALDAGRSLPAPPPGAPGPFGLADPVHLEQVLADSGWRDTTLDAVDEPMWLGADPDDAWEFVRGLGIVQGLTGGLSEAARTDALARLRTVVEEAATPDGVVLGCASWLVTAHR